MSEIRKKIGFEGATWHALQQLALEQGLTLQQLADEAFQDLLRKRMRPVHLLDALRASARLQPANDARRGRKTRKPGAA